MSILGNISDMISKLFLKHGGHKDRDEGMCLLEAVAYIAGEPHSDHPSCTDPVLGAFGRAVNDWMTDDERQLLVPIIPDLVGTAGDHTVSLRRAMLICDGVVRQILPLAFDGIKLDAVAKSLRDLEPVTDEKTARAAWSAARSAESAAWSAAWSAWSARSARSAAESAASAARSARSAAESAASAARSARSAARKNVCEALVEIFKAAAIEVK